MLLQSLTKAASLALVTLSFVAEGHTQTLGWTKVSNSGPSARRYHGLVYDSDRRVCVLFGGSVAIPDRGDNQTWEWDGRAWTQRASSGPRPRWGVAMAYDQARKKTVLFGGYLPGDNGETWEYDGTSASWTPSRTLTPAASSTGTSSRPTCSSGTTGR